MWPLVLLAAAACDRGLSPSASVDALVEAVKARDSVEVARFLDLQRVAESAVDPLIGMAEQMMEMDPDGFGRQTGGIGVEMLEQFRPMIAPLMEQVFWQMLLTPDAVRQGPLAAVLGDRDLEFDKITTAYQGVVYEREAGEERIAGIQLAGEAPGAPTVTIEVLLEAEEGYWHVVAFIDLAETLTGLVER